MKGPTLLFEAVAGSFDKPDLGRPPKALPQPKRCVVLPIR
jgi:hypothetical protein